MGADHSDVKQIQSRLRQASARLQKMTALVGHAYTVREYDSDRRKHLLAKYMAKHLKDESATAAEALARGDEAYVKELDELQSEYESAQVTLANHNAEMNAWETCRSLLAMQRETFKNLRED